MSTAVNSTPANCPNCDAAVSGNFCANCGQEAVLHHASTREFLHEFVGHYVALEGKLWGTMSRLLFRPGLLTIEYIRGRRVRFVQPLRIYLTLSLLFFALLKITGGFDPVVDDDAGRQDMASTRAAVDTVGKIAKAQSAVSDKLSGADPQSAAGKTEAEAAIAAMQAEMREEDVRTAKAARAAKDAASEQGEQPDGKHVDSKIDFGNDDQVNRWLSDWPRLQHSWQVFEALPGDQQKKVFSNGFYRYAPYAIFCLMPVFALLLKVLYLGSGRRFGEHVLFALHTNAFAFFMFGAMLLIPFGLARFALFCWLLGYLPWAMRRVYHSGRFGTFLRWSALMLFYSLAVGIAVLGSMLGGIMSVH